MKHTVKHMLTVCLSVLLVLTMVLSLPLNVLAAASTPAPATAGVKDVDGDGVITYVSFGDSVTNGYGMDGYRYADGTNVLGYKREVATAYPAMTAKYLESKGFKVELEQLAVSGYRMDELHWLLDMENFQGDQYHNARFADWNKGVVEDLLSASTGEDGKAFREMCKTLGYTTDADIIANASKVIGAEYVNAVKNADLITIDLGTNNFGTFMTSTISGMLGMGSTNNAVDFSQYMDAESAKALDKVLAEMVTKLVGTDPMAQAMGNTLARCLMYGYLGYVNHYDAAIERIYALNPDAQVVVLDVYSMISGVELAGGSLGNNVDLDVLYNLFIDMANHYARELSPWAAKVTHATLDTAPALFIDYYKSYESNMASGTYKDSQYLHPTAERLMNEFIMEAMGSDPDNPEERAAFEQSTLKPLKELDSKLTNLKATIDQMAITPVVEGVSGAITAVDAAIAGIQQIVDSVEGVAAATALADVIIEQCAPFAGIEIMKDLVLSETRKVLKDYDLTIMGFTNDEEGRAEAAVRVYELAVAYNETKDKAVAKKNMVLEIMIQSTQDKELSELGYAVNEHYQATAGSEKDKTVACMVKFGEGVDANTAALGYDVYYGAYKPALEAGKTKEEAKQAGLLAAIAGSNSKYAGEGVAQAMVNIHAAVTAGKTPAEADVVKVLGAEGVPGDIAKKMYVCYTTNLDGKYTDSTVKAVALFFIKVATNADDAGAEATYQSYLTYKNVALTLSKIAKCDTIYFDALLAEAAKGLDMGAIAQKFMAGTLNLDKPAENASAEVWAAYKADSALATLYFRFLSQDGVFTHPSEAGQDKLAKAVQTALGKLNVAETDRDIVLNKDSKVLVLGDFIAGAEGGYASKLNQSLGVTPTNLSNKDYRINEVRALLDSTYAGDAYTAAVLGKDKEALTKTYTDAVKNSNVILLNLGAMNMGFVAKEMDLYVSSEGKSTYAMQFASIANMAEHKLGQRLDAQLTGFQSSISGFSTDAALLLAFESFCYGYTTFADCLDNTVETIQKLNPNADIVLVGQYNMLDGAYYATQDMRLELGEFINRGTRMMNDAMKTYAEMTDNVTYVDLTGIETQAKDMNMAEVGLSKAFESALPTAKGAESIAQRIACALSGHAAVSNLTWTWAKDYSTATAAFHCDVCGNDVKITTVPAKEEVRYCDKEGTATYTAAIMIGGESKTDVKKVTIPVSGHVYDKAVWTWEKDYSKATASFTCINSGCGHVETVAATIQVQSIPASCENAGKNVYTATATVLGKTYTDVKEVAIPGGSHQYGAPVWEWAEDLSAASVVRTCSVCKETQTNKAEVAASTTPANCNVDGKVISIAKVKIDGKEYSDTKTKVLPAGHKYDDGICTVCGDVNSDPYVVRLYGENRYQTAFGVADELKKVLGVSKFENIIVASGSEFADALAGSYLAAVKNAPILITNETNADLVKIYIAQNLSTSGTVYILGGPAAVEADFEDDLIGFYNVKRLAGENRYETNVAILDEAGITEDQEILVCTGRKFADSLSASAVGKPILLVKDTLYKDQKTVLSELGTTTKFVIIGGESAVSAKLEAELKTYGTTERIGGENRYETAALLAERFFEKPGKAVLAYGQKFPDGLCGGPLAYNLQAPMLLTKSGLETVADDYTDKYSIKHGYVLGGEAVIATESVGTIFDIDTKLLLGGKETVFTIDSIMEGFTGSLGNLDMGALGELIGSLLK